VTLLASTPRHVLFCVDHHQIDFQDLDELRAIQS